MPFRAVSEHQIAATSAHSRPLKNVGEAGKTRQKRPKKGLGSHASLRAVNEHFEAVFNAVLPTQVVFQRPASARGVPESGADARIGKAARL